MSDEQLKAFARPAGMSASSYNKSQSGMNLRDWIMGQVLAGCAERVWEMCDGGEASDFTDPKYKAVEDTVRWAYEIADIAMRVREEEKCQTEA